MSFILTGPEKPPREHGRPQSCGEPEDPEQGKLFISLWAVYTVKNGLIIIKLDQTQVVQTGDDLPVLCLPVLIV